MLDAASLDNLTISSRKRSWTVYPELESAFDDNKLLVDRYRIMTNRRIEDNIDRVRTQFKTTHTPAEFTHYYLPNFGNFFLGAHRVPSRSGAQLIIQLACLLYYGKQHPSWEVLSIMLFRKGRLDWMQVVSPPMFAFSKAAVDYDDDDDDNNNNNNNPMAELSRLSRRGQHARQHYDSDIKWPRLRRAPGSPARSCT
jgi:Choline/Carnitine o-acyltransferase